jgi:hypothetical protein
MRSVTASGLIDDGAPPSGLYGGDPTNYPGSTPSHILLREGYPSVGQNVMAPSSGFEADVSIFGSFNELAEAYMRNQVIIEPTQ